MFARASLLHMPLRVDVPLSHFRLVLNASNVGQPHKGVNRGAELLMHQMRERLCDNEGNPSVNVIDEFKVHTPNNMDIAFGVLRECIYLNRENTNPLVVFGGDHFSTLATGAAFLDQYKDSDCGLVWIDAHPDLNTPHLSESGNLHGTTVSHLCGMTNTKLVRENNAFKPEDIVYIGLRSIDPYERLVLDHLGILHFTMEDIRKVGMDSIFAQINCQFSKKNALHISFDVDVMHHDIIKGTGTIVPGGMTLDEMHRLSKGIQTNLMEKTKVIDVVEYNPDLTEQETYETRLITSSLLNMIV